MKLIDEMVGFREEIRDKGYHDSMLKMNARGRIENILPPSRKEEICTCSVTFLLPIGTLFAIIT